MSSKQRLSATVDAEVLAAAEKAVAAGRVANVSAWVNEALHRQAEHERRMAALDEFLAAYEEEYGVISDQEIQDASRRARARAVVVRGKSSSPARGRRRTRPGAR